MASGKTLIRYLLVVVCLVVSVASLVNVYGDNAEVEAKAKQLACTAGKACGLTRLDRSPFAQTYEFHTWSATVTVRCTRSGLFFGEYGCVKQ